MLADMLRDASPLTLALYSIAVLCIGGAIQIGIMELMDIVTEPARRRAFWRTILTGGLSIMKRFWFFIMAVLVALAALSVVLVRPANAQTPPPTTNPMTCLAPTGMTATLTAGTGLVSRNDGWGEAWAWWCPPQAGFTWILHSSVMLHDYRANTNLIPRVKEVLAASSPVAAANHMLTKYGDRPASGSRRTNMDRLENEAKTLAMATRPADPTFRVATNGQAADRPAYAITGTRQRATAQSSRAPIGALCTCRKAGWRDGAAWCTWEDGPTDQVTMCREVQ